MTRLSFSRLRKTLDTAGRKAIYNLDYTMRAIQSYLVKAVLNGAVIIGSIILFLPILFISFDIRRNEIR